METAGSTEYFPEIVYLRALAILAVISIHVSTVFYEMGSTSFLAFLYMSIYTFSDFAVPLFVGISGFVLYNRYTGSYSFRKFYTKRFLAVVPQYTLFSLFAVLFVYIGSRYSGSVWNFTAVDILYQYVTGDTFYYFWFFILIIQLYILYPLLEKMFTLSVEKHATPVLLVFLLVVQLLYSGFFVKNIGNVTVFLAYIFYFVLGMFARLHYLKYKKMAEDFTCSSVFFLSLLLLTLPDVVYTSMKLSGNNLTPQLIQISKWVSLALTPLYYLLIFTVSLSIAVKMSDMIPTILTRLFQIIGKDSFGIFLVHGFVLSVLLAVLFPRIGFAMDNWLFYPVAFIADLGLTLVVVYGIKTVPYHEYIIGSSR